MSHTYLTTEELATRMKYDVRTIRNRLKDSVLLEGIHYFRPFGGRKILFIWEAIEKDMQVFPHLQFDTYGRRRHLPWVRFVPVPTTKLFFDFTYLDKRCREQTTLPDTPANRKAGENP